MNNEIEELVKKTLRNLINAVNVSFNVMSVQKDGSNNEE